ncbi:MAG TPA: NAD(P)-binding domain-containing protein [Stellaceae bacterium]|nr:NAD(P)-binding domain-containing protein [Stellaceae bacterium]
MSDVIIIGAGPYGLSLASHLRARGVNYRIFGRTMENWRSKMPRGMALKSDGFASNLVDPDSSFTLQAFCQQQGIPYADEGIPVALETFIAYGDAFQRRFVPNLEERMVVGLNGTADGFAVQLDDGEIATAPKIIIGIGISDFTYVPPVLADLPPEFCSHAAAHGDLGQFRGRNVAVVGSGSSAIDIAALLHEAGATTRMVARRSKLSFHSFSPPNAERPLLDRLREPRTGIGHGWRNLFFTRMPHLFRYLPEDVRLRIVANSHGPAGGWFMRDRVMGQFDILEGFTPQSATVADGRVQLQLTGPHGNARTVDADHVIAATGYKVDMAAVKFLDDELRGRITTLERAPVLSRHFETSVPGLYIIGPAAACSFGPGLRFVHGAEATIPPLARHLASSLTASRIVRRPVLAASR